MADRTAEAAVNFIVLGVGAYEANEQGTLIKEDHRHDAVAIAPDVEHVAVIAHVVNGVERLPDVG